MKKEINPDTCSDGDHMQCARRVPIFAPLDDSELKQVTEIIVQKRFEKDAFIIREGDIPRDFFIVNSGKIKVYSYSPEGREQIMYVLNKGDFFGARNLVRDKKAGFFAQAAEDTVLCTIDSQRFRGLLFKYPAMSLKIMEVLCDRLERMESMFCRISPREVDSRVSMLLLELSQRFGRRENGAVLIELPMSREEMAGSIGVARETVSRKLALLKKDGIIDILGKRRILILDEDALAGTL
ncbi:MAG: Crp/Fnr family transcriptional regulator [Bacillota bacterium]